MCKPTTNPVVDEFIDDGLQGLGVRFTDETARCSRAPRNPGSEAVGASCEKAEGDAVFQKRKRRVMMVSGLVLTTAAMIAFIECGQISYALAMCFNAVLAGAFGYNTK